MSLQFVFGNSGAGKSHYVFEHIIEESMKYPDKRFIILVPEQFTLQTQKELIMRHPRHGIMNIDVLSFARLAFRVMDETGNGNRTILDDEGKNLILRKIAGKVEDSLSVLKGNMKKQGYISEVKSVISEFTQYGITPDKMEDMFEAFPENSYASYKLKDIQTIYESFEEFLKDRYITKEEMLDVLCQVMGESDMLKNCVVALDGYTGFTPVQNKVIGKMLEHCEKVYVTVTMDSRENPYIFTDKMQLFMLSKQMVTSLVEIAKQQNAEIEEAVCLYQKPVYRFKENPVMAHLEEHLFRSQAKPYLEKQRNIRIYQAANPKEETICAAQRIRALIRNQGYRYRDIAVIASDMNIYGDQIEKVFKKYGIPVFMDYKRSVLLNSFVEYVRSLLDMVDKNFSSESVLRFLRTGFTEFTNSEIDKLENYLTALGIKSYKKWQEKWLRKSKNMTEEELEEMNHLRVQMVEKVDILVMLLKKRKKTVKDITFALYEFIEKEEVYRKIKAQEERFLQEGDQVLAKEYAQIYRVVMELFDKFVLLLGDEYVSLNEFSILLDAGFEEARIGVIPPGMDEVMAGDIERTRLKDVKALILLGVNDTLIPGSVMRGGILSERERDQFEECGIALAPGPKEKMYIQKFYLYLHLTKPTQELNLCYSNVSMEGKSLRPAYLVGEIMKLFPMTNIFYMNQYGMEVKELIPETAVEEIIRGLRREEEMEKGSWQELYRWYMNQPKWKAQIERLVQASMYHKPEDHLTKKTAEVLYGDWKASVSRLEKFAACSCAHFLRYGLRLQEKEEYEFLAMDFGNVFHAALDKYAEKLEQKGLTWVNLSEEEQEQLAEECVEESFVDYSNTVLYSNARNEYMVTRMKRMMKRTIWGMTHQLKKGKFKPSGHEVSFGSGKIDRIDTYETDDKVYVKIVDYKTGSKTFDMSAFYHGLQMQLVVYLKEAMELEEKRHPGKKAVPAGIFYYKMKDPLVEKEIDKQKLEAAILEELKLDGYVNMEDNIIECMDMEFSTASQVIPVKKTKTGYSKTSKMLTQEEFEAVLDYAGTRREELQKEMRSGKTDAYPYQDGTMTGCEYCNYKHICGFDEEIDGYEYKKIRKMKEEEVLEKIKEKVRREE